MLWRSLQESEEQKALYKPQQDQRLRVSIVDGVKPEHEDKLEWRLGDNYGESFVTKICEIDAEKLRFINQIGDDDEAESKTRLEIEQTSSKNDKDDEKRLVMDPCIMEAFYVDELGCLLSVFKLSPLPGSKYEDKVKQVHICPTPPKVAVLRESKLYPKLHQSHLIQSIPYTVQM